jgi:hypothetical protein
MKPTMELIRPRFVIERAERQKLETNMDQKVTLLADVSILLFTSV